jgi:hypothetical protein
MNSDLRNIAHGFHSVKSFDAYDVNGYRFHTHEYTTKRANRKTINSGVLCEGSDKLHYYGRVEAIYELNYNFGKGLNPVVFKCHWFDPHRVRRDPTIGLVEVERSSVYAGVDVYILATQAFQVFYLPYQCKKPSKRLGPWDVVITVPPHNRPPLPNSEDYRRLDPSRDDGEFYQDGGLPGKFTINLPSDVEYGEEDGPADMEEDTALDEVEDVHNQEDVILLERFRAGLDLNEPEGPPPGSVDGWWCGESDSDDENRGPVVNLVVDLNDLDTGY